LAFGGGDLLKAAKHGKTDLVRALLDQEAADIDETRNGYGNSALHLAATYGHLETVRLLLAKGANVEATNSKGKSPLYYAACEGKEEVGGRKRNIANWLIG
jgi:ankyrin repeat protein